jgi:hypothetical protein
MVTYRDILAALDLIENPYEEDDCIVALKNEKNIIIRGPEFITESGYAYHVSVTVPNTQKWREKLEKSLGVSYTGCKPDINVVDGRLEFGLPIPISEVVNIINMRLSDEANINIDNIPEKIWNKVAESDNYKESEKEVARQQAAGVVIDSLHLKDIC